MTSSLFDVFDAPPDPSSTQKTKKEPPRIVAESAMPARDLVTDLVNWLEHGKTEVARAPGLHASSLWKTCARSPLLKALFSEALEPDEILAGSRMTWDEGHALHDLIQNRYLGPWGRLWGDWKCLKCQEIVVQGTMPKSCPKCDIYWRDRKDGSQNIVYAETLVVDDSLNYCGHCDGLLLDRTLTKKRVFEFKTISKSQYGSLREPLNKHTIQVHAYMHALKLREAIVLYWDKGSQCDWSRTVDGRWLAGPPHLKSYLVKFSNDIWLPMIERIADYHEAAKLVEEKPSISEEDVAKYPRLCSHTRCDLAIDCPVRDFCFRLSA